MKSPVSETCQQLIAQLSLFLDGELDATVCAQVQRHLASCPDCRVLVDTMRQMLVLYRVAPRDAVSEDAHARLVNILERKGSGMDKPIKIAIATEDGARISAHFGRAPYFEVLTVERDQIVARERRAKTFHQAGEAHDHHGSAGQSTHASMIGAAQDCVAIIAGGMGKPAFASIQAAGLQAVVTDERDIERAARAFAAGTLTNHTERLH